MLIGALLLILAVAVNGSVNGIIGINGRDHQKLLSAFTSGFVKLQPEDLDSVYYAAKGYAVTKTPYVKVFELDGCHHLKTNFKPNLNPEVVFHALSAFSLLKCEGVLSQQDTIIASMKTALNEGASTSDIRFAMEVLQLLKQSIPNPAKIAQNIQAKLKEDDSLVNLGHALHAAAFLGTNGKFINERIEDIVVQADEIDGKLLQFEGGLSVTSLLLTGLYKIQGVKPLNQEQIDKFANYLLTRRSVQTAKGALALLDAAQALSKSSNPPVCITLLTNVLVSTEKPQLRVQVSDLLGNALVTPQTPVVIQSGTRVEDNVVVLSKQPLSAGKTNTEFTLPINLEPGHYKLVLSAGSHNTVLTTKVIGPIKVDSVEVGVVAADGSQAAKLNIVQYPEKIGTPISVDGNHNLVAKVSLPKQVHQAFLRLYTDKKEIIFIGERDNSKLYKIVINLGQELTSSAIYNMELIIGDSIMSNPIRWEIGAIDVNLSTTAEAVFTPHGPKPEIQHLFREPEKRPAQFVSMLFTGLCLAPFLVLLITWLRIGVPLNYFNIYSIPFHCGYAGIMGLYTYFWLCGNMFTTCAWLLYIGGFTFIAGNRMLRSIADKSYKKKAE